MEIIEPKEFDKVAQLSHFAWGAMVVFLAAIAGHPIPSLPFYVGGLWIVYSAVKEFWYDEKYETPIVRGNSMLDFVVASAGVLFATGVLLLSKLY